MGYTIGLASAIDGGTTQVICNDRMDEESLGACDVLENSLIFNGDDALVLVCGSVGTAEFRRHVDRIGQVGMDPGSSWGGGDLSTKNATLRRNCDVEIGDGDVSEAFTPSEEFTPEAIDVFDGLGQHCE